MKPSYKTVAAAIDAIEAEMKKIGWWQDNPPAVDPSTFKQAFGGDQIGFSQWLQLVLIPNVRRMNATHRNFPSQSMVAAQAVREFDGQYEANDLITLLSNFDDLFS